MEGNSEGKVNIEDIWTKPHAANYSPQRPKNFSLRRRSEVYYFSDESPRGILKCVPVKHGSYQLDELQTVLDSTDATKIGNEIWSDVPLNIPGSSKANKNSPAPNDDVSYESEHHNQKRETASKPLDKTAGNTPWSHGLKNLSILETYKSYTKAKNDVEKPLKVINQDEAEQTVCNLKGSKMKAQLSNPFLQTNPRKLKRCVSDEKYNKPSACNIKTSSSKISDDRKDNHEFLSETWTEESLNDFLDKMSIKTPVTEL